jgi:hypothetical protein
LDPSLKPKVAVGGVQAEERTPTLQISMVWMEDAGVVLEVFNYPAEL